MLAPRSFILVLSVFVLTLSYNPALAERRTALVIGNGAYKTTPLKNPVNDATDMAAMLKTLGFEVRLLTDATQQQMENAVREFGMDLRKGGVGLFYYAGHGLQVAGENYLIPVNAIIQSEGDAKYSSLNAGLVLAKMEDAGNGLNLVILDACRSNPYSRGFRSAEQGLARMDAPTGSILAYATAPGAVASDGKGRNGVYTRHLLENMTTPGLPISEVFMRVRQGVVAETQKKQVPWENTSLIGQFYFANPPAVVGSAPPPQPTAANVAVATQPVQPEQPPTDPGASEKKGENKEKNLVEILSGWFKGKTEEPPTGSSAAQPAPKVAATSAVVPVPPQTVAPVPQVAPEASKVEIAESVPPPAPLLASVELEDIKAKAHSTAKAVRAEKKKWATWQTAMRKAYDEVRVLEKDKSVSAAGKVEAWSRVQITFSDENPYSDEAQQLRAKIQARIEFWSGLARKEVERKGSVSAKAVQAAPIKKLTAAEIQQLADEGERALESGDFATAARSLPSAAEQGNAKAQGCLGMMYALGDGVALDSAVAFKWLKLAADQGDAKGQFGLGRAYALGLGVGQNYPEALRNTRLAADQGFARAMANLGHLYFYGQGTPKNPSEALKWYQAAAAKNDAYGQNGVGVSFATGSGVPQNYEEALKWFHLAASQSMARAQANIGQMYFEGHGVKRDISEAYKWFSLAAEQGDEHALLQLGQMSMRGLGVAQNYTEAVRWLTPSAQQGNAHAQASLGWIYYKGLGVVANYQLSHHYFSLAVANGFSVAQKDLETVGRAMNAEQLFESRRLTDGWRPKTVEELGYRRSR